MMILVIIGTIKNQCCSGSKFCLREMRTPILLIVSFMNKTVNAKNKINNSDNKIVSTKSTQTVTTIIVLIALALIYDSAK